MGLRKVQEFKTIEIYFFLVKELQKHVNHEIAQNE